MTTVPTPAVQLDDTNAARREQYRDAMTARSHLSTMLAAAGVRDRPRMIDEPLAITLPPLNTQQASRVAALMRQGMAEFFITAEALSSVGEEHCIPLCVTVVNSKLQVADLTMQEADRLATLLGRPGPSDVDPDHLDDPSAAEAVVNRLREAIEDATGVAPAADLMPACFCLSCGHGATVQLLPIDVQTAKRLLSVLSQGEEPGAG